MKSLTGLTILFFAAVTGCESEQIDPGDIAEGNVKTGKRFVVSGEVEEWSGLRTFVLSNAGPDFEDDLLVVSKQPLSQKVYDGVHVRVTGVVRECEVEDLEKELGFELPASVTARLDQKKRCLLADKVVVTIPGD